MKKKLILLISILFIVSISFADTSTVVSNKDSTKLIIPSTPFYTSEDERKWKLEAFAVELKKKRNVAIAGTAVFSTAILFDYAVIQPAKRNFNPNDPSSGNDRLAMLSPGLLIWMMKLAGSTMSSMRVSESVDEYVDITGDIEPVNISWKLYWTGWGVSLLSQIVGAVTAKPNYEEYKNELTRATIGLNVTADLFLFANGIYSILYTGKMKKKALAIPVKVIPTVNNSSAGLSLIVKF